MRPVVAKVMKIMGVLDVAGSRDQQQATKGEESGGDGGRREGSNEFSLNLNTYNPQSDGPILLLFRAVDGIEYS